MGRNGAGKSTLLRALAGLDRADRGQVRAGGRVALLLQRPGDHLLHEGGRRAVGGVDLAAAGSTASPIC